MAKGEESGPSASEKGKGKAPSEKPLDGTNHQTEQRKDKDGNIIKDGKDNEKPNEGTLHLTSETCGYVVEIGFD